MQFCRRRLRRWSASVNWALQHAFDVRELVLGEDWEFQADLGGPGEVPIGAAGVREMGVFVYVVLM